MEQKKSEFNKVLNAWDVLVIAFGAMIGWGWVVSTGGWIEKGGVLGAAIGFVIGGIMIFFVGMIQLQGNGFDRFIHMYVDDYPWICQCGML